ncbi:MAG: 3-methyl-2-oxobutanoate hydroxymethyltransferase [Nitriliruptoraceae bacterium]
MSVHPDDSDANHPARRPVTVRTLAKMRADGERFAMVTASDAASARLVADAGVPVILVGDSLAMVALGYPSTLHITLDEMVHHTRAVRRGAPDALIIADMPFGTFQLGVDAALKAGVRLMQEGHASGVKLEGGQAVLAQVRSLVAAGIPVMGHLGLTPQSVHQFGGFTVQARDDAAANTLVDDARALEAAGAFSVVLECVPDSVGQRATEAVTIPTIGIGAGPSTSAQVLVFHDLLGLTSGRLPRFVKPYANLSETAITALRTFNDEVANGTFPGPEHCYGG